jgi:hypothetical protein
MREYEERANALGELWKSMDPDLRGATVHVQEMLRGRIEYHWEQSGAYGAHWEGLLAVPVSWLFVGEDEQRRLIQEECERLEAVRGAAKAAEERRRRRERVREAKAVLVREGVLDGETREDIEGLVADL